MKEEITFSYQYTIPQKLLRIGHTMVGKEVDDIFKWNLSKSVQYFFYVCNVTTFWQMSNRVIHVFGYSLKPKGICTQAKKSRVF